MTAKEVRNNFVQNLAENAYLNMCSTEEMKIAIEALEKQIPKKSKQDEEYPLGRKCPGCYRYLSNVQFVPSGYHYCENCGQALDWGEEE